MLFEKHIPEDNFSHEKLLNKFGHLYSWPEKLISKTLINKKYENKLQVNSDLTEESIFWFLYESQIAKNNVVQIQKGQPFNYQVWPTWDNHDKNMTVSCWSLICPDSV